MDGNRKLHFSLFGAFSRHRVCNVKPQSSTRAFPVRGKQQNHAKKETFDFRLPSVAHERLCLNSLITQHPGCTETQTVLICKSLSFQRLRSFNVSLAFKVFDCSLKITIVSHNNRTGQNVTLTSRLYREVSVSVVNLFN